MSNKKTSSARFSIKIKDFEGVDSFGENKKPLGSARITNFLIDKNGSLQKRCGFRQFADLPSYIDALWYGTLDGQKRLIALSNYCIIEVIEGKLSREIGRVDTCCGQEAHFFFYDDCLFLKDCGNIYRITSTEVSPLVYFYAPLIGKDWDYAFLGAPNEKKNLLSDYVRISFVINDSTANYLRIPQKVDNVVCIYKNGNLLNSSEYSLDNANRIININSIAKGDAFEVLLKYPKATDELSIDARSAIRCSVFNESESRPYLWGSNKGNLIYYGKYLSMKKREESRTVLNSVALYVTEDDVIEIGKEGEKITAIDKHFGRTVVFTENDAWRSEATIEESENSVSKTLNSSYISDTPLKFTKINDSIGSYAISGVTLADNVPISIGKDSIYKWNVKIDDFNEKNAVSISSSIDTFIPDDFRKNGALYFDRHKNIVYFYSKKQGIIWVWSVDTGKWVSFTGFTPDRFFDYDGKTAFTFGEKICYFDDTLSQDIIYRQEYQINASFKSNTINFDNFEDKHMTSVNAFVSGGNFSCYIYMDDEVYPSNNFTFTKNKDEHSISERISSRRFKSLHFQINAISKMHQAIYSLELNAR